MALKFLSLTRGGAAIKHRGRPPRSARLAGLAGLLAIALPAIAPGAAGEPVPASASPPALAASQSAAAGISLRDAILLGLAYAYDIRINREKTLASAEAVAKENAVFDPKLVADLSRSRDRSRYEPFYSLNLDAYSAGSKLSTGLERKIESGATVGLAYELKSTTVQPAVNELDTSYQGSIVARISQPLLRNFGPEVNRARIEIAIKEQEISRSELHDSILRTADQIQDAYWTLHEAREALEIRRQSLAFSRELLQVKQQEVRLGALASVQLVQIQTEIASDEADLMRAQRLATDAEVRLKRLLGLVMANELLALAVSLDVEETPATLVDAITRALANRAEALKARLGVDVRQTQTLLQKNQTLPDLEARLAYGYKRLGDSAGRAAPAFDTGERNNWEVNLRLTLPIGNREAKAEYGKSLHELRQAELLLAQNEDEIRAEVVRARADLSASRELVAASETAMAAHARNLDAEQQKLRAGLSTIRDYLFYQNALIQASLQWVSSRISYQRALFAWHRTMAELPAHLRIDLVRAEADPMGGS